MPSSINFLTVTHSADLPAFRLLRKSLRQFAPDVPHVVLVDDEELSLYQGEFGQEKGLTLKSSKDVLPARWEKNRKLAKQRRKGGLLSKIAVRLGFDPNPMIGWHVQQLMKMYHLASSPAEVVIFLDSDLMLTQPFRADAFFEDGKLVVPEARATSVEDFGFEVSSRVMLGESRGKALDGYCYIHQPPRFYARTGRTLVDAMTKANAPVDWPFRFIRQQWPSEYHLLGYAARGLEQGRDYVFKPFVTESDTYEVRFPKDVADMEGVLTTCLTEKGRRGFLLVQSNLGIHTDQLLARLDRLLDELLAAHRR